MVAIQQGSIMFAGAHTTQTPPTHHPTPFTRVGALTTSAHEYSGQSFPQLKTASDLGDVDADGCDSGNVLEGLNGGRSKAGRERARRAARIRAVRKWCAHEGLLPRCRHFGRGGAEYRAALEGCQEGRRWDRPPRHDDRAIVVRAHGGWRGGGSSRGYDGRLLSRGDGGSDAVGPEGRVRDGATGTTARACAAAPQTPTPPPTTPNAYVTHWCGKQTISAATARGPYGEEDALCARSSLPRDGPAAGTRAAAGQRATSEGPHAARVAVERASWAPHMVAVGWAPSSVGSGRSSVAGRATLRQVVGLDGGRWKRWPLTIYGWGATRCDGSSAEERARTGGAEAGGLGREATVAKSGKVGGGAGAVTKPWSTR